MFIEHLGIASSDTKVSGYEIFLIGIISIGYFRAQVSSGSPNRPSCSNFVFAFVDKCEITGNGKLKEVHANSPCAFSGQEDLQWYTSNDDITPVDDPVKGDPAHSQNWGHVKQATGLTGGANSVPAAELGCNGHEFGLKNGPNTGP